MSRLTKKKYGVIAGITAVLLVIGGIAYAYWTSTGDGAGTATTGTDTAWQVDVTDTLPVTALTPGGPSDDYSVTVTNNSAGDQNLNNLAVVLDSTSDEANCPVASNYSASAVTFTGGDLAAGGSTTGTFTISMVNLPSSQDLCKNVTVNFHVHAS